MLSGIKFIPREHVNCSSESPDSESSPRERRESRDKKRKDDKRRMTKICDKSSDDNDNSGKSKRRSKSIQRSKKKTTYNYDDDVSSQSTSQNYSDSKDEKQRRNRWSKKKKSNRSSDEDVSSSSDEHDDSHKRISDEKRKGDDIKGHEDVSHRNKEAMRKEMGLDWMFKPKTAAAKSATVSNDANEKEPTEEARKSNPKELNPYFKDNGSGFPDDETHEMSSSSPLPSSVVGDGGASWRLKALKRAREQAVRDGRNLNDVVEERWGSLGQLAASVTYYRAAPTHAHLHAINDRRRGITEKPGVIEHEEKGETGEAHTGRRDYLQNVSSRHPEMKMPKQDSYAWRKKMNRNCARDDPSISDALSKLNKFANDGSFMAEMIHQQNEYTNSTSSTTDMEKSTTEGAPSSSIKHSVEMEGLSSNQLAAKALRLRLKGKHEDAEKLLKEAEALERNQISSTTTVHKKVNDNTSRYVRRGMHDRQRKEEDDGDLNLAQKIIQNKRYNISQQADDEHDFDEAPVRHNRKKNEALRQDKLAKRILTQQERCQFCFENPKQSRHLIISVANFTYLMLPEWQPVVQGHCCILPLQHESSTRTLDDNVWEEMRNFKKCLIMMFAKKDMDVIFLETVIGLSKLQRHCLVECIPLPSELAKEAPLYFKKAIDESADEWSQHHAKRLIETTSQKGLRRSIPKDFPYFHVEFGLDRGFVHVIDEEDKFKNSLGLNVIRGMLRLPEEDMYRRRRHEPMEKQRMALASFALQWEPFDWTKQLT